MPVQEHWTSSGRALVVTAKHDVIQHLAYELRIADATIVPVTPTVAALALWGTALDSYLWGKRGLTAAPLEPAGVTSNGRGPAHSRES